MKKFRRPMLVSAVVVTVALSGLSEAWAEPVATGPSFATVPGAIAGTSPDGLGTWSIHYQRVDGGNADVVAAINDAVDAEAMRQVQHQTWDASTKRHWEFDATGTAYFRSITVSELFVGKYDTDELNVPWDTVASVVFDSRSGILINWDNLFRDKTAGLTRLSELTATILPTAYPPPHPGDWQRSGGFDPIDINFKCWIPTAQGIELHFPDHQFGKGLKVITVPWGSVADVIAPEFLPIMA
jgi:hypothetical protein